MLNDPLLHQLFTNIFFKRGGKITQHHASIIIQDVMTLIRNRPDLRYQFFRNSAHGKNTSQQTIMMSRDDIRNKPQYTGIQGMMQMSERTQVFLKNLAGVRVGSFRA